MIVRIVLGASVGAAGAAALSHEWFPMLNQLLGQALRALGQ